MTDVIIAPRVGDPLSGVENVITGGWFQIRPTAPYILGSQWVLDVFSPAISFNGAPIIIKLDPVDISYELRMSVPDGKDNGSLSPPRSDFRLITNEAMATPWEAFVQVSAPR